MPNNRWTREQDLAVLYIKLEYRERALTHPDVRMLAKAMERTEASIWMRKGNFDSLDHSVPGGLSNCANLTRDIWAEYERNPDGIRAEARKAYLDLRRKSGS